MEHAFDSGAFLRSLSHRPGVYRMLDTAGRVLYVGKARDLKKRVSTYFGSRAHQPRIQALMGHTDRVEVTVTGTEQEALLLEYNLIKQHRPRYNVVLRDDKSYPWVYVSTNQEFPRIEFHRGARSGAGRYFGPWPSAGAVRESLGQLQRLFRVRQCSDSFFSNRTRPCLQHQIRRCSAPCVGLISPADYQQDVADAILFLQGRNEAVITGLLGRMEKASAALDFERAAELRDQIARLRRLQTGQVIAARGITDADAVAVEADNGLGCVAVLMIRAGRVLGSRTWFPKMAAATEPAEILGAFVAQHYLQQVPPDEILLPEPLEDGATLETVLSARAAHAVRIRTRVRGVRRRWLDLARANAAQGLAERIATGASLRQQLEALGEALGLEEPPARIECFDISHTAGGETVASCVVFGTAGPVKSDYRRFNITGVDPGDDYGALAQAVTRRYLRMQRGEAPVPDLILIDGGRSQLGRVCQVLQELQLDAIPVVGVAKGRDRRPGQEMLFLPEEAVPRVLPPDAPALRLIQQVRDEAHRFAITGHRQRRNKARRTSTLESIAGLGPARRRALLRHFGGLQGLQQAGVTDLEKVQGISRVLAERIYDHLHGTV